MALWVTTHTKSGRSPHLEPCPGLLRSATMDHAKNEGTGCADGDVTPSGNATFDPHWGEPEMTIKSDRTQPTCVQFADLYQHPVLDQGLPSGAGPDERRQAAMMARKAQNLCQACPLVQSCLYDAVVKHEVAGFVAQTTQRQRNEIRRRLGVSVTPEDFDTLAGVMAPNRQVDHDEVIRLRRTNPDESLETLAHRLGCSLSTVKRHLRRARSDAGTHRSSTSVRPTPAEVTRVAREVVTGTSRRPRTAAAA